MVCVDEALRFAVPVLGAHQGGGNALARRVAETLDAEPVITTASDAAGTTALDDLGADLGFRVEPGSDLAAVGAAILSGDRVTFTADQQWPLPALPPNVVRTDRPEPGVPAVVVTDSTIDLTERAAVYRPPSLIVGVGTSRGAPAEQIGQLIDGTLAELGLSAGSVRYIATADVKADEPGLLAAAAGRGWPVVTFPAGRLAAVPVPNPSEVVRRAVGTPSVAEAAALIEPGATLLAAKRASAHATVAVARGRPRGRLAVIGIGPGARDLMTPRAVAELRRAAVVVGLDAYLEQVADLLRPGTRVLASGLGAEQERAAEAVAQARAGRAVALIGSGDAGVYAMGSPALEIADDAIDVTVVPGVTAALAVAAVLGAPLGHDHVMISLSDLHTAWPVIERRITAAAEGDLVTCFYNPASAKRTWQLRRALELLAAHRPPATPVGWVRDASRPGQAASLSTLRDFDPGQVDMHTLVVVGSSRTRVQAGRMVTPRDYRWARNRELDRHHGMPWLRRVPAHLPRARDPAWNQPPAGRPRRSVHRMRRVRGDLPGRRDRGVVMTEVHPSEAQVHPIEAESYRILRSRIDLSALPPLTRAVTERVIHATADFDYVTDLVCDEAALAAGVAALRRDAPVIADVAMVAAGITGYPVTCKIGDSLCARLARTANITLSAAAVRLAHGEAGPGAIWLVGCAPTALAEIMSRQVEPALVIGVPVGFVGAADAKDDLRASGLPALSNVSEKGGSAVAVAAFNALLRVARAPAVAGPAEAGPADPEPAR